MSLNIDPDTLESLHNRLQEIARAQERLADAEERKAAALENLAAQMPAFVEALGKRGGGENWSGKSKEGKDWGLLKAPPDLAALEVDDVYHLPVTRYVYDVKYSRLQFFMPFTPEGKLAEGLGMQAGTIKPDGKTFPKIFKKWKYSAEGAPMKIGLRILKLKVGADKEDATRRFAYIDGVAATEDGIADPEALTYAGQPVKAAESFSRPEPKPAQKG